MDGAGARIAASSRAGAAFVAEAWRDAWAALGLLAFGQGAAIASGHLDLPPASANLLSLAGWGLSAVVFLPALGALYRSAVGGPRVREIGVGGLQAGQVELRIASVLMLLTFAAALALAPLVLIGGAIWYPLRDAGVVRLPMIGPFGLWFVLAAPVLLLAGAALGTALCRLALALPATAAAGRLNLGEVLRGSRRWSGSLALTAMLTELAPVALLIAIAGLLAKLEHEQAGSLGGAVWPLADTLVAAAALPLVFAFLILPFGVGARTAFYGRLLAEQRAARRRVELREARARSTPRLALVSPGAALGEAETVIDAEFEPITADAQPADAASKGSAAESEAVEAAEEPAAEKEPAAAAEAAPAPQEPPSISVLDLPPRPPPAEAPPPELRPAARWTPPVAPLQVSGLAQAVTTPVLLAHANDREPSSPWWFPPEHPGGPPVA